MLIITADEYTEHGCNIRGNLVIVKYMKDALEASRLKPAGGFGSQTTHDYLDQAKKLVADKFGDVEVCLAIPDLVCRIGE